MSDNEVMNELPNGQAADAAMPVGIESHPKFQRQTVPMSAARSIVPPPPQAQPPGPAISADDLLLAIATTLAAQAKAQEAKAKREARKQANAATGPAAQGGRKAGAPSLTALFIDDAAAGKFGEFAAEAKEETSLVRRWNGAYWQLVYDMAGKAEAMDWLRRTYPDAVGKAKAVDCWESLGLHLYKHCPFAAPEPDEDNVVFPLKNGYLHITATTATMKAPDKTLGLTFQVKAKADVEPGQEFVPTPIPPTSRFGRYLALSLPNLELRNLIQEQCAMSFLVNNHQTVAWWVGDGGAGKGTLAKLIESFHHKIATLDLHKLSEPHHLEDLVDASLVRVDEVAQKGIWGEKEFKSMVSGDCVAINPKFKKNFTFRPKAYWIITTNQPPLIRDESDGVRRRIIPVPWSGSSRARGFNERDLDVKIMREESHLVLGWIVEGLQRYLQRGGPMAQRDLPMPVRELMAKIHHNNDNVVNWLEECEVMAAPETHGFVHTKKEVYEAYAKYTEADGGNVLKEESFWIRFWRRTELKTAGVVEGKGTGKDEKGAKIRIKEIRNLALTPAEIAAVKKAELSQAAIERGSFKIERHQVQVIDGDPFAGDPDHAEWKEIQVPVYDEWEQQELERLELMAHLTR